MESRLRELLAQVQSTADFAYVAFDSINDTNAFGDNALHCVCVWGELESVVFLVENGVNINQKGEHGFAPVRVAAEFGFPRIVEYLLSKGADPVALEAPETFDRDAHRKHSELLGAEIERLEKQLTKCNAPAERGSDA